MLFTIRVLNSYGIIPFFSSKTSCILPISFVSAIERDYRSLAFPPTKRHRRMRKMNWY